MATLSGRMTAMMQQTLSEVPATNHSYHRLPADIIDLSSAENPLIRAEIRGIIQTAEEMPEGAFSMPATFGGDLPTRQALATFFNTYFHPVHDLSAEHITITPGAGRCLESLIYSLCDEGDGVIIPAPYWYGFQPYVTGLSKVNLITTPVSGNATYVKDLIANLESAFSQAPDPSKIKALVLCNPHNPLSQCYPRDTMLQCLRFCQQHGLHLISDEPYALANIHTSSEEENQGKVDFISALSVPETDSGLEIDRSYMHVVWSVSKLFGLTGLRIGCLISPANPSVHAAVSLLTFAGTSYLSASTLTMLLTSPQLPSLLALNSQRLSASYAIFAEAFRVLGVDFVTATHGLFIFARLRKNATSLQEGTELVETLKDHGLLVSPGWLYDRTGEGFGWARITIAVPEDVAREAVRRFGSCLSAR